VLFELSLCSFVSNSNQLLALPDCRMQTKLYKVRWLIVALLFFLRAANNVTYSGAGLINNFFVAYFDVSSAQVDWVVLGGSFGSLIATPLIGVLVSLDLMLFRRLAIASSVLLVVDFSCFVIGLLNRSLFPLIVLSQIAAGIPLAVLDILPGIFAPLWFPEHQVGTAIGAMVIGMSLGTISGSIGLTHAVGTHFTVFIHGNTSHLLPGNVTFDTEAISETRKNLLTIYGALLGLTVVSLIFLFKYAKDQPSLPPTPAQASKRKDANDGSWRSKISQAITNTKALWSDSTFVMASIIFGIANHCNVYQYTLLGEMLREKTSTLTSEQSIVISGYTTACFSAGACIGCFLGGFTTNRFKHYSRQTIAGSFISFVGGVGFSLGFVYNDTWLLMLSNFIYGSGTRISMIPLYVMITQHTYPMDETISCGWMNCIQCILGIAVAELSRLLYTRTRSLGVLLFQSAALFSGFLLTVFIKPKYGRLINSDENNEAESILSNDSAMFDNN